MFVFFASRKAFVFQSGMAKINQQSDLNSRRITIIDELSLMLWCDRLYGFEFDDHFFFNKNICVIIADALLPEHNLNRMLR